MRKRLPKLNTASVSVIKGIAEGKDFSLPSMNTEAKCFSSFSLSPLCFHNPITPFRATILLLLFYYYHGFTVRYSVLVTITENADIKMRYLLKAGLYVLQNARLCTCIVTINILLYNQ